MKKLFFIVCCLWAASSFAFASAAYPKLRTGSYFLSGGNTKWDGGGYHGEVTIEPQGENYSVVWRIGTRQAQYGVGILYNDILSVAFCESDNTSWGVASFRLVADGELQGRWTNYTGTTQKPEYLIWKGY